MAFLTAENVMDLTQKVWATMVSEGEPLLPGAAVDDEMAASVGISGEWNGIIGLCCSRRVAVTAAAALLGLSDEEINDGDIDDAIGELANVVGGNIKGLVPGPSQLSLPALHNGSPPQRTDSCDLSIDLRLSWMAEPVVVRVWTYGRR